MTLTSQFCDWVKERSGGRIEITPYYGGQLAKPMDTLSACAKGVFELFVSTGGYWKGFMPVGALETGLPMGYGTSDEAWTVWYDLGLLDLFREAYAEHNIYYLAPSPLAGHPIMSTVPIRSVADLKGLKIRSSGANLDFLVELGAESVSITGGELYTALQLGTVDACTWSSQAMVLMKFYEVCPYYIEPPLSTATTNIAMNMDAWKALPDDLKNVIQWSATEWVYLCCRKYREQEEIMEAEFDKYGVTIITLPEVEVEEMMEAAMKVWDDIAAKSPRCAKAVGIWKDYLKVKGRIK